jgi:hypothetical protein
VPYLRPEKLAAVSVGGIDDNFQGGGFAVLPPILSAGGQLAGDVTQDQVMQQRFRLQVVADLGQYAGLVKLG